MEFVTEIGHNLTNMNMTNESDKDIHELLRLYRIKFDEKTIKDRNDIVSITIEKYMLSSISILLKAIVTIRDEPWTICENKVYSFPCIVDHLSYSRMAIDSRCEDSDFHNTRDVCLQELEDAKFLTAKKLKCLQDSDVEMVSNPDWSINNIEVIRNRNNDIFNYNHVNEYLDIDTLFRNYNELYLNNFELYLINEQRQETLESPINFINLLEEIKNIILEYKNIKETNSKIENSKYFLGYPCLNPDITYNIILNNHYKKIDLIVDKIIKTPTDEITLNECHKLLPVPKIIHKHKIFTENERLMFSNGISTKQYNIDPNNCHKVMINLATVITAHAGFDTADEQCLIILANVISTYIKKIAVIMKKNLDTSNQLETFNTESTDHNLQEMYVNGGFGEIIKSYEYDIIHRRNKLLKDCEQLQHFIDQYFINPILVINKIKNQYITYDDLKLNSINEKNVSLKENKSNTEFKKNTEVTDIIQTHDTSIPCSLITSIKNYIYTNHHIKTKIIKFIIKKLLENINNDDDDIMELFFSTELKTNKDLFYSIFKENVSTFIKIKPKITNIKRYFKPSTFLDQNSVESIIIRTPTKENNIEKEKNVPQRENSIGIELKTKENESINSKIKPTKPEILINPNLIERMLTDNNYQNKICFKFLLALLIHGMYVPFINHEFFIENETEKESKIEGNECINVKTKLTKPEIEYTHEYIKSSTSSDPNDIECMKYNSICNNSILLNNLLDNLFICYSYDIHDFLGKNIENMTFNEIITKVKSKTKYNGSTEINQNQHQFNNAHKPSTSSDLNNVDSVKTDATCNDKKMLKFLLDELLTPYLNDEILHNYSMENNENMPLKKNETEIESITKRNKSAEINLVEPKISNTNKHFKQYISTELNDDECMKINSSSINKHFMEKDEIILLKENDKKIESSSEGVNESTQNKHIEPKINIYNHMLSVLLDPSGVKCMETNTDYTTDRKMQCLRFTKKTNTNIKCITKTFNGDIRNSDLLKPLPFEEDNEDNYKFLNFECSNIFNIDCASKYPISKFKHFNKNNQHKEYNPNDTTEQKIKELIEKLFTCNEYVENQDINQSHSKSINFNDTLIENVNSEIDKFQPLFHMMIEDIDEDFKHWKGSRNITSMGTRRLPPWT